MKNSFASKMSKQFLSGLFATILVFGMAFFAAHPAVGGLEPGAGRIFKAASKQEVKLGEIFTYTIHLEEDTITTMKVSVTDPLPRVLDYVPGSASHEGIYDPATRTITWAVVVDGATAPVDLKFDVKNVTAVKEPTPVVNTATISSNGFIMQRQAWVTLMPEIPVSSDLSGSFKTAKPRILYAGETVFYAIRLLNSGTEPITVKVADPVPSILTYVPGSASHGGVFDEATKTIYWKDIVVPPYSPLLPVEPVTLSFTAKAPNVFIDVYPIRSIPVLNTAIIVSETETLKRAVEILLVPQQHSPLEGSYKTASHRSVFPGQTFTYSIYLHNSSPSPVLALVSDPLPPQVTYVQGSANADGQYDEASRTIIWKDLTVLEGSTLVLTFDVTVNKLSVDIASITNTAYITSGNLTFKRSITTPIQPLLVDTIPPFVYSLTIGKEDVNTDPAVVLQVAAGDNVGVQKMYLQEWVLSTDPFPHWRQVNSSGWVPYIDQYPWKLSEQSGTHYITVWVADAAGNRSRLTRNAIDFASLLLPGTGVDEKGLVPYMVYYPAGIEVTAELKTQTGAADLFVWFPGNLFYPDQYPLITATNPQKITFTTKTAGIYLFLVYGVEPAVFDLSITPGGGPRLPTIKPYGSTVSDSTLAGDAMLTSNTPELDGMTFNPILPQSGLDPLDVALDPIELKFNVFVPIVRH